MEIRDISRALIRKGAQEYLRRKKEGLLKPTPGYFIEVFVDFTRITFLNEGALLSFEEEMKKKLGENDFLRLIFKREKIKQSPSSTSFLWYLTFFTYNYKNFIDPLF